MIWALFRNGVSPGGQGADFRMQGPGFELAGPQLGFLRVNSDWPVPWKSSNSSSIYPLSPWLEEPPVGREPLHPLVLTP